MFVIEITIKGNAYFLRIDWGSGEPYYSLEGLKDNASKFTDQIEARKAADLYDFRNSPVWELNIEIL